LVLPEVNGERPFFTYSVKPPARKEPPPELKLKSTNATASAQSGRKTYGWEKESKDADPKPAEQPYDAHDRARLVIMHTTSGVPWSAVVAAAHREGVTRIEAWQGYGWDEEAGGPAMLPEENLACLAVYGWRDDEVEWEFDEK
jgi:hypothetical protein